jgi:hypothetical protein
MSLVILGCSNPAGSGTATVSLAAQSGTITSGAEGTVTFAATTAHVADGTAGSISWYADSAGTSVGSVPAGITPMATNVTGNSATVSMLATASTATGTYYFKAIFGTSTSAVATLLIGRFSIGDSGPAGGIVFYDKGSYSDSWRYLEAAPSDQSAGIQWWNGSYTTTGATATVIGTGTTNTATIIASQGAGSYAAEFCADLTLGGYSDWFLPSKDELNQMYVNLKAQGRGGFASDWYWSSSESASDYRGACFQYFVDGNQDDYVKTLNYHVRAARAF